MGTGVATFQTSASCDQTARAIAPVIRHHDPPSRYPDSAVLDAQNVFANGLASLRSSQPKALQKDCRKNPCLSVCLLSPQEHSSPPLPLLPELLRKIIKIPNFLLKAVKPRTFNPSLSLSLSLSLSFSKEPA